MEFYSSIDYRHLIDNLIKLKKEKDGDCNYAKLADAIRVQRPYFSKVMNHSAELSEDQLHLLCDYFKLLDDERGYLELLLQFSKTALKTRKDILQKKIYQIQSIKLDIKNNLDAQIIDPKSAEFVEYFLNPKMQIVHVALNIKKYQKLENLLNVLDLSKKDLLEIMKKLEILNLIEFKNQKYIVKNPVLHLPKDSNLLHPHQSLIRLLSLEQNQKRSDDTENYSFSVTFSCDIEGRKKIQEDFLKYLKSVQKTVQKAGSDEVYQLNFDLFSWTK